MPKLKPNEIAKPLDEVVYEHCRNVLREFGLNRSKAAKALGITTPTLRRIIESRQLSPVWQEPAPEAPDVEDDGDEAPDVSQ